MRTRWSAPAGSRTCFTILVVVTVLLAGSVAPLSGTSSQGPGAGTAVRREWFAPAAPTLPVPATLYDPKLGLRAGPVPVPVTLRIPSLGVDAAVLGVGITAKDVMDAPMGPADDPVWQQAFWYRGSAVPGAPSTALIAGHVAGAGRLALFAHLDELKPGNPIIVHDTRTGLDVRFAVTESDAYSLDDAAAPAVLARIYGAGPVAGRWPQPSVDGLAHLTLITCAGAFANGTHDHRLVVYATRVL